MKAVCLSRQFLARPVLLASLILAALAAGGCSTTAPATTNSAPRSNVSRDNAMALAELTARSVGGSVYTIAPTGSMKPTLDETSVVAVEPVQFAALRQGDIVIYRSSFGAPIIHRLYERHGDRWLVLGDNNGSIDRESVTQTNFLGRVCAIFYTSSEGAEHAPAALARR